MKKQTQNQKDDTLRRAPRFDSNCRDNEETKNHMEFINDDGDYESSSNISIVLC